MSAPDDARKEEEIAKAFGREMAIIEAAARALESLDDDSCGLDDCADWYKDKLRQQATAVLAAVTPMIEAAALERAARAVETHVFVWQTRPIEDQFAAAIRALKPPAESSAA